MQNQRHVKVFLGCFFVLTACGQWHQETKSPEELIKQEPTEASPNPEKTPTPQDANPAPLSAPDAVQPTTPTVNNNQLIEPFGVVLSEGDSESDFAEWAAVPEHREELEKIGSFNESKRILTLKGDATLSFSNYARQEPFKIRTAGFNLMLIGAEFGFLEIQSHDPQRDSGNVVIYSSAQSLPIVDTSGHAGLNGADGDCRRGRRCVSINDRDTTQIPDQTLVELRGENQTIELDWNDERVSSSVRQTALNAVVTETDATFWSQVPQGCIGTRFEGPSIEGRLIVHRHIIRPTIVGGSSSSHPLNAELRPGMMGERGFNAGYIKIFSFGGAQQGFLNSLKTSSGPGGIGGLNLKSPRTSGRAEVKYDSFLMTETLEMTKLIPHWTVNFSCPVLTNLAMPNRKSFSGRFKYPSINVATGMGFDSNSIIIPAVTEGRDDLVGGAERAPNGPAGKEGTIQLKKMNSRDEWQAAIHPEIPIPKKCLKN